jgi:uncharacterized heparinase superfamily protein
MTSSPVGDVARLWRTVRWLRREQWLGRMRLALVPRPSVDLRPAPHRRPLVGPWVTPAVREASLIGPARWRILGREHELGAIGWDDPSIDLLWRYNQHYFDDLNARGATERRAWQRDLIERWRGDNAPGTGTAWAPYPTSLRIVNWIKFMLAGEPAPEAWLDSLATHARWLMHRIEWHLLGNHLFANAKALAFAGFFFEGPEADAWRAEALRILGRERREQFLADGAQFERSPMYHALALEDVLDLINVARAFGREHDVSVWCALIPDMLHWLRCMLHPSGAMGRFNDCAPGIGPPLAEIERYAAQLGLSGAAALSEGVHVLQPSGYVRVARGACTALLDVAPIGPDYLPGHAHADTLSFEFSLGSREVVVNRGTSVYGTGPRRQLERSTAAHSTVQVGSHDSSEVWAGFRVGRRARPSPLAVDGWNLSASHDGYCHLPGSPVHRRQWQFEPDGLRVVDRVEPARAAKARFHLAPSLSLDADTASRWLVRDGERTLAQVDVEAGSASIEPWQHALAFGELTAATTLVVELDREGRSAVHWTWAF